MASVSTHTRWVTVIKSNQIESQEVAVSSLASVSAHSTVFLFNLSNQSNQTKIKARRWQCTSNMHGHVASVSAHTDFVHSSNKSTYYVQLCWLFQIESNQKRAEITSMDPWPVGYSNTCSSFQILVFEFLTAQTFVFSV